MLYMLGPYIINELVSTVIIHFLGKKEQSAPGFHSQHPPGALQTSVTPVAGELKASSGLFMHVVQ